MSGTTPPLPEPAAISAADAAAYLGLKPRTLSELRQQGRGPAFVRVGHRTIVYLRADLDAWLDERRIQPLGARRRGGPSASPGAIRSTDGRILRGVGS